ncbi:MAG: two-component sensor histidine kinase [Flavobacteriia bacterium]|nr:MAG: two-component sensor histidine kinase [Flavobacteriia bacterium]
MSKRIFTLLIVLMGFALIGIIAIQIFWIKTITEIREEQFSNNVINALAHVSENIQEREFQENVAKYSPMLDSLKFSKERGIKDFFYKQIDTANNEVFTFRQRILEDNYKTQISPLITDTLSFKTLLSKEETNIDKVKFVSKDFAELTPKERVVKIERLDKYDKLQFENFLKNIVPRQPITQRVSVKEIQMNLDNELRARNIKTKFEFAVFNEDLMTKVKSENFKKSSESTYQVPLFLNKDGHSDYQLYITFPNKKRFIVSAIAKKLALSAVFILIIMLVFAGAIYQLVKQKKISAIKTDFINNMTHEFKTPIATINLAIDSIKNPKIISDKEKVIRYVEMIREENKRMHAQVENVLRISKLEKNQLDVTKKVVDLHEMIDGAISHVDLLVSNRDGYIKRHYNATSSKVLANKFHFTNVLVNILDNAIKYSEGAPKIDIYTENTANTIIVKFKDQGIGMNKAVQKKIFDKFYREQGGNIHNVKGHGLGLAYVKRITEMHHGTVYVESEKNKGSTFIIKLPLI